MIHHYLKFDLYINKFKYLYCKILFKIFLEIFILFFIIINKIKYKN